MTLLLTFAIVLLAAVLVSALANRTVLSTAVLFLVAGFLVGEGVLDLVPLRPEDPVVELTAELALFAVLFTHGMKVGFRDLRAAWRLPGRALGIGLPLVMVLTALLGHYVVGLPWVESFLLGAILAPTDPVFASALVGNDKVPGRLRHLLNAFAIGLIVYAVTVTVDGNLFLAAFAAGVTVASFGPAQRESFEHFGELIAELRKLLALLMFGALISPQFLGEIPWQGWVFAVLAIVVARPLSLVPSFVGTPLTVREQLAAMWFGPKGFASVVYGLIVLGSGIAHADEIFHLVALTIVLSILAHSSTDVVVARAFDQPGEAPHWQEPDPEIDAILAEQEPGPRHREP